MALSVKLLSVGRDTISARSLLTETAPEGEGVGRISCEPFFGPFGGVDIICSSLKFIVLLHSHSCRSLVMLS